MRLRKYAGGTVLDWFFLLCQWACLGFLAWGIVTVIKAAQVILNSPVLTERCTP